MIKEVIELWRFGYIFALTESQLNNHSRKFHDQNEKIVDWWLSEGFRDNPDVIIIRSDEYNTK